jgi:two-component system, OmpR family, sensor histidine kinase CreC
VKNVSLTLRLFLIGAVLVLLAGWVALYQVLDEIKPAVRQSTEETLVDTANLLAEMIAPDLRAGTLTQAELARVLSSYGRRNPGADIWGVQKEGVTHRIYVTDARGIVLVDSAGLDVGKDYSRWNDVLRSLRGQYGARSTEEIPGDERTTVMYVAAPIRDGANIIGVVTVAKPNRSVQPYIERAQQRLVVLVGLYILGGLLVGALLSLWLSRAIRRLTRYADAVTAGDRPVVPLLPGGELNQLARALDTMRAQLEGKAYIERYVQTLTHELKSPLAGIHGATELLRRDMATAQRERFLDNIDAETARLQSMADRLLHLAQVEQRRGLEERVRIDLHALVEELKSALAPRLAANALSITNALPPDISVLGERFLLRQALSNLLDNAVEFTPAGRGIWVRAAIHQEQITISIFNEGELIPDYALPRLTERFYSLPRPATGRKSTGLGLNFVSEVAGLHGGSFHIVNDAGGVRADLTLPVG